MSNFALKFQTCMHRRSRSSGLKASQSRATVSDNTVKPVLSGHLKIDKTNVLMKNGILMEAESIAERSPWGILQYF